MITAVLIVALLLLQVFGIWLENRNRKQDRAFADVLTKTWDDLGKVVRDASVSAEQMKKQAQEALRGMMDPPVPRTARRAYAALLTYGTDKRLYLAPATSMEEFAVIGKQACGDHWLAEQVEYIDLYPPPTEIIKHLPPTKTEKKIARMEDFVHQLELARDTFTESEGQKRTVESIIKNVKQKYGQLS